MSGRSKKIDVAHLVLDSGLALAQVGGGIGRVVSQWIGQCGSYQGALAARESLGCGMEVVTCHGFDAVYAMPHFDRVEVNFHDPLFGPKELD